MMKPDLLSPLVALVLSVTLLSGAPSADAKDSDDKEEKVREENTITTTSEPVFASYTFSAFNFDVKDGVDSPLLSGIDLNLTVYGQADEIFFRISNDSNILDPNVSATNPTITRIYFDDDTGLLSNGFIVATTGTILGEGVTMSFDASPKNVPGGRNIGFEADLSIGAAPPPSKTGIDPSESISLSFTTPSATSVIDALNSGELRVALHVQEIGQSSTYSAGYVNIPEPSSALLLLVAGACVASRRGRRRA